MPAFKLRLERDVKLLSLLTTSRERRARVPQDKLTQQHRNASNVDQSYRNGLSKIATAKIFVLVVLQGYARTIFQPALKYEVKSR
jgi:hypothetical protein